MYLLKSFQKEIQVHSVVVSNNPPANNKFLCKRTRSGDLPSLDLDVNIDVLPKLKYIKVPMENVGTIRLES